MNEYKCSPKFCPYHGGIHPIGARREGQYYNSAAIPQPLAEEVAHFVDSEFYVQRIRRTEPRDELWSTEEQIAEFNKLMQSTVGGEQQQEEVVVGEEETTEES